MSFTETTLASADRTPAERSAARKRGSAFRSALAKRHDLTDDELASEEHLLIAQTKALAAELGLQSTNIGQNWSRKTTSNEEHST